MLAKISRGICLHHVHIVSVTIMSINPRDVRPTDGMPNYRMKYETNKLPDKLPKTTIELQDVAQAL